MKCELETNIPETSKIEAILFVVFQHRMRNIYEEISALCKRHKY